MTLTELKNQDELPGDEAIFEAVSRSFDRAFDRAGVNKKSVNSTFEAAVEGLRKAKRPEARLRSIAKSAVLATGRRHGNVIDTSKTLLDSLDQLSEKHKFKHQTARDQVLLGLAEAACQLGPVIYCRLLEVAKGYRDEADEWILENRRIPVAIDSVEMPVLVPYESELTLKPKAQVEPILPPPSEPETFERPAEETWSRPKGSGIFQRLSDALGQLFRT